MSFILDALKKLEQKRQQGTVPDLMTVHTPGHRKGKKRLLWPYLILIALLMNAGILIAFLQPEKSENQVIALQSDTKQKMEENPIARAHVPPGPPSPDTEKKASPVTVPADKKLTPLSDTNVADQVTEPADAPPETDSQKTEAQEENAVPEDSKHISVKTSSLHLNLSEQELEVLRNKIKEEQDATSNVPESGPQSVEQRETDQELDIPEYSELSEDIKRELPEISISGHIYSNSTRSRLITINGNIFREGERVTEGLEVQEITLSGAVFSYNGLRFHMRAF